MFLLYCIFKGFFVRLFVGVCLLFILKGSGLLIVFWVKLFGLIFILKLDWFECVKVVWGDFVVIIEVEFWFNVGIGIEELLLELSLWGLLCLYLELRFWLSVVSLLVCNKLVFVFFEVVCFNCLFIDIFIFLCINK